MKLRDPRSRGELRAAAAIRRKHGVASITDGQTLVLDTHDTALETCTRLAQQGVSIERAARLTGTSVETIRALHEERGVDLPW